MFDDLTPEQQNGYLRATLIQVNMRGAEMAEELARIYTMRAQQLRLDVVKYQESAGSEEKGEGK